MKYLVFHSCLNKLLKRCSDCGDIIIQHVQHKRKTIGSMLSIELTCHSGQPTNCNSQPAVIRQEVVTTLDTAKYGTYTLTNQV